MIRLLLARYLLASLCCAYRSWGILSWEDEWQVMQTVTPAATPTPRADARAGKVNVQTHARRIVPLV